MLISLEANFFMILNYKFSKISKKKKCLTQKNTHILQYDASADNYFGILTYMSFYGQFFDTIKRQIFLASRESSCEH